MQQAQQESKVASPVSRARRFASLAMQASGIGRQFELDMTPFEALPCLTAYYCKLAGDDFKPYGVCLLGNDLLRIAWKGRLFEFSVDDNSTWYDPVTHTDMLNLILSNQGKTSKRFYVFDIDQGSMFYHVAYLEAKVARLLVDKFRLVIIGEHDDL